eukprot:TRINITY_DN90397_c0_g1_i1.p1 TRINITY_DN90397_c0_g1~~TRINITY_DN90397_c0_g1_i1.p1  ORF type:complete len:402 (+),score=92.24 TRINITY_DN90397_c0_g1_i1:63-1268(+)
MLIQAADPLSTGMTVGMKMLDGKAQMVEAQRLAQLQTTKLSAEEKAGIQKRRSDARRRRVALEKAEGQMKAVGTQLQARIAARRAALQEAEIRADTPDTPMASTPPPKQPNSEASSPAVSWPPSSPVGAAFPGLAKRQRSDRLTFSAMTEALEEAATTSPPITSANSIAAAQELAAAVFAVSTVTADAAGSEQAAFKLRHSLSSCSGPRLWRGAKRSIDGIRRDSAGRSSTGIEAMTAKAKVITRRLRNKGQRRSSAASSGAASTDEEAAVVKKRPGGGASNRERSFSFGGSRTPQKCMAPGTPPGTPPNRIAGLRQRRRACAAAPKAHCVASIAPRTPDKSILPANIEPIPSAVVVAAVAATEQVAYPSGQPPVHSPGWLPSTAPPTRKVRARGGDPAPA